MGKKSRMPEMTVEIVHARSQGRCEAKIPGAGCSGQLEHLHHRKFRSGGEDHSVSNVIALCMNCHSWVHGNKREARDHGWALSSHSDVSPELQPVLYRGRTALLAQSGAVEFVLLEVGHA